MERVVKFVYIPIGLGLIGYFILRLIQGSFELHWVGVVLLCNTLLFWAYPISIKSAEEAALKYASKIFEEPLLVSDFLKENNMSQKELEHNISKGKIEAYELDKVLVIENKQY